MYHCHSCLTRHDPTVVLLAGLLCYITPTLASAGSPLVRRHGADEPEALTEEGHDECFAAADLVDYSVPLHIAALFVILVGSTLGSLIPIISSRYPRMHLPDIVVECGKFFGAGVILATSLIHMLPGAMSYLTNPCVPERFRDYSAFAGLFTMLAILFFHLMEHLLTSHFMQREAQSKSGTTYSEVGQSPSTASGKSELNQDNGSVHHGQHNVLPCEKSSCELTDSTQGASPPTTVRRTPSAHDVLEVHSHHTHVHGDIFLQGLDASRRSSTYVLELGIALHSILIGLALGTTSGTEFISLWVALVLHQFFEGFALGSRLASLTFSSALVPITSALAFAITTPIGIIIGMGVRTSYQPNSPTNMVVQGILDSLAAGILLYAALVNLIAQEFSQPAFFKDARTKRALYFLSMYAGAAVMAIIGIWA
ncbi:hypothetical protein IWQ62_000443 [Dispira parvispora]|uniref:Zinc/iron permease n=1 Tax=Dispira parvispora TaxID=1520584 RepID=A0A9W8AUQ5_9FUNG|nr:hypothetical protein IWQ62_000443 [Dispira parvispora]